MHVELYQYPVVLQKTLLDSFQQDFQGRPIY